MIRIRKPDAVPQILRERGVALTAELCNKFDAGERPSFDRDIYGAAEVKEALCIAQHDKCCFCESKLSHAQFGDVEHFRPKASAQQSATDDPRPGYYWLAYAWENLYLSCEVCNRRHKRAFFPLANPDRRVSSHRRSADLHTEQPLFVDPGHEDPTRFIEFRREYAAAVERGERGSATIDALQLNRSALAQQRREHRQPLKAIVTLLAKAIRIGDLDNDALTPALDTIISAAEDSGPYASMTRSFLHHVAPWRDRWTAPSASLLEALRTEAAEGRFLRVDEI